ncbi:pilus assembly protein PilP [Vibrio methylphosphonaticus]|uniref:pilus assembly protein PilP n=1 Tax=Vibrio methylphosphonaticus TaxID=2946866 RepID=UPI00202A773F|nr:pilus assembly protein PilP [Vibrio methylphosphonaticus]MCL9775581.1 pilus assembly protein PilP [Vibrio methylphosphonaticus]
MRTSRWVLLSLGLLGCQANDDSLADFVAKTEAEIVIEVAQLQPRYSFDAVPFTYAKQGTPFDLPKLAQAQRPANNQACWQPKTRGKGNLEQYRLEELTLKGVMSKGKGLTGLLQLPNRQLVKVTAGQYIGENNGQIKQVTSEGLIINETLSDGLGCWFQRQVKLALN